MAYSNASVFFLIALILFATGNPLAHGQSFPIRGIIVAGRICCNANATCPGVGLPGVGVNVTCTDLLGIVRATGQNVTGPTGNFTVAIRGLLSSIIGTPLLPCTVRVQLPLNQTVCPILGAVNGTLVGVAQVVGSTLTSLGLIVNAIVPTLNLILGVGA